jgi:hypothetical protein
MKELNVAASVTPLVVVSKADPEKVRIGRDKLKAFIEEETKLVKGRFRCLDNPGSAVRIQVRKYKDVPMFDKTMIDEGTYEIPLYVARHLNGIDATATHINGKINSCSYPIHGFKAHGDQLAASTETMGPDGITLIPIDNVVKRVRRYGFESLEFSID